MPNVLVRDVDETLLEKLKAQARQNGRSLQTEVLAIISSVVNADSLSDKKTAEKIKNSLRGRKFSDSAASLREDRSR